MQAAAALPVMSVPIAESVRAALETFFASRAALTSPLGPGFAAAARDVEHFVLRGGKRVRPAFAWTGWLGAGGDPASAEAPAVITACAALELVQACALIHDDVIDSSRTRRGNPTVHVSYAAKHRARGWAGDAGHFGESAAVLLGDLALAWADDMLLTAGLAPAALSRAAGVWSAMRTEVLGGQYLDICGEASGSESVDDALRINRYKTAAYTIERPLHLGAALAGADPALIAAYREFGTDIGVAFQLRDDLLGVFGNPAVTGKPSGDDLREGKRTVLLAVALQAADQHDHAAAALLRASIGTALTDAEVERLREIITGLGAVRDTEQRISSLTARGLEALDASTASGPAKAQLREMALAATQRST